jgi:hypothetical protein
VRGRKFVFTETRSALSRRVSEESQVTVCKATGWTTYSLFGLTPRGRSHATSLGLTRSTILERVYSYAYQELGALYILAIYWLYKALKELVRNKSLYLNAMKAALTWLLLRISNQFILCIHTNINLSLYSLATGNRRRVCADG